MKLQIRFLWRRVRDCLIFQDTCMMYPIHNQTHQKEFNFLSEYNSSVLFFYTNDIGTLCIRCQRKQRSRRQILYSHETQLRDTDVLFAAVTHGIF